MKYLDGLPCYQERPAPCQLVRNTKGAAIGYCGLAVPSVMQEQKVADWNCNTCFDKAANELRGLGDDGFDEEFSWGGDVSSYPRHRIGSGAGGSRRQRHRDSRR